MEPTPPSWSGDARRQVLSWIAAGHLDAEHLDAALDVVDGRPPATIWRCDLDRLLLGLGILFILAGLVLFIAANWEDMGKNLRFVCRRSTSFHCEAGIYAAFHRRE